MFLSFCIGFLMNISVHLMMQKWIQGKFAAGYPCYSVLKDHFLFHWIPGMLVYLCVSKIRKTFSLAYVLISLSLIFHPLCFQNIYKLLVRLKYRTTWMKQLPDFKSKILLCVNKNRLSTSQLCNLLKGTRQHKFVSISNIHVPHPELNVMLSWWVTQSKKITCVLIRYLLP